MSCAVSGVDTRHCCIAYMQAACIEARGVASCVIDIAPVPSDTIWVDVIPVKRLSTEPCRITLSSCMDLNVHKGRERAQCNSTVTVP